MSSISKCVVYSEQYKKNVTAVEQLIIYVLYVDMLEL